ncbi:MAG: hypothetical protein QG608_3714 [Actinomycetota bacterium]|nr:hypothetical protein [Actinomycetota bacterium]
MVTPTRDLLAVAGNGTTLTGVTATNSLGATGRIQSAYAGKCIDVASGSTATGTAVQLYDCNGTTSQLWNFPGDGSLRFKDRCLDLPPSDTYGTPLQIAPCTGSSRQTWDFRPDGTLYNLYNTTTRWCVVVPGADTTNRTRLVSNYCTDTARKQLWELRTDGQGPIRSAFNNICLDSRVQGENDDLATIHTCDETPTENWIVFGDGALRVDGKCLDVPGSSTANDTELQTHTCNGTQAQQWRVGPNNTLVNDLSRLCLDIPGGKTANNTPVRLHTCNNTEAQRWTLP